MPELRVCLDKALDRGAGAECNVLVWRTRGRGVTEGFTSRAWLESLLGCTRDSDGKATYDLIRLQPNASGCRKLEEDTKWGFYAKSRADVSRFHDTSSLSLVSAGSVRELNRRLEEDVPVDCFRANFVVSLEKKQHVVHHQRIMFDHVCHGHLPLP